jgi:ATP-dependent helicase Lhr and Lhr-like helicase
MCQDNRAGDIEPPDHPLVNETLKDCLHEAMDLDGLAEIVAALEQGALRFVAVETPVPSPMSHEILNANPYAFLDDAPLEERRARAVSLRRIDPDREGAGALDPAAVAEALATATPGVRDAHELHDLLLSVGLLPIPDAEPWGELATELADARRAAVASWPGGRAWVPAERLPLVRAAVGDVLLDPPIVVPARRAAEPPPPREEAVREIVRGWIHRTGPITAQALAGRLGLAEPDVAAALLALEAGGVVLRGSFTGAGGLEWCERRLLSRIHRITVGRLRREIEPVPPAQLMRFLLRWQHLQRGTRLHGREGVAAVIGQLQGLELPAPAWEEHVLPARVEGYTGEHLEYLCLSGTVAWGRLHPPPRDEEAGRPRRAGRATPIGFALREDLPGLRSPVPSLDEALPTLSTAAQDVAAHLADRGASFLPDIARATGRLAAEVEDALWELVAAGLLSGDGTTGLRGLLRRGGERRSRRLRSLPGGLQRRPLPTGRWDLWLPDATEPDSETRVELAAEQALRRWGVVLRELVVRDRGLPAWRDLVRVLRRWEAQGRIRGGRFVAGLVGEQFALPEAVEALRAVRRTPSDGSTVILSAADPLNLVGILLPGERVPGSSGLAIAYRDGEVAGVGTLGELRSLGSAASVPGAP